MPLEDDDGINRDDGEMLFWQNFGWLVTHWEDSEQTLETKGTKEQ